MTALSWRSGRFSSVRPPVSFLSKQLFAGVAAVLTHVAAFAVDAQDWPKAPLRSGFQENLREEVPLSGSLLVGATVSAGGGPSARNTAPPIFVFVPASAPGSDACVTVRSRDGRYRAENRYELPPNSGGSFAQLDFPSDHPKLLRTYGREDVTVLARPGPCESPNADRYLPASWGEPPQGTINSLILAVNGGRKKVTAEILDTDIGPVKCRRIGETHTKAFDTLCELDIPGHIGPDVEVKLTEYRIGSIPLGLSTHRIRIRP